MTGVTMSLFGSHPHLPGGHVQTAQSNIFKSEIKKQLGFSIDSIVGKSSEVSPRSPPASPVANSVCARPGGGVRALCRGRPPAVNLRGRGVSRGRPGGTDATSRS